MAEVSETKKQYDRDRSLKYYYDHTEGRSEYKREYYQKNKERILERAREKNREKSLKKAQEKARGNEPIRGRPRKYGNKEVQNIEEITEPAAEQPNKEGAASAN